MSTSRRRPVIRPSRGRLIFWAICTLVIVYLAVHLIQGPLTSVRVETRTNPADEGRDAAQVDPDRPSGPPAVRFGLLNRAAHLPVLAGLELDLYTGAVANVGWMETRIFSRAPGLISALKDGELDMAVVPLRAALSLFLTGGERAPRIVAGVSLGDEMYVARGEFDDRSFERLGPVRVVVLAPPTLDLRHALRLDGSAPPTVILGSVESLPRTLASREVDLAVLPEPDASHVAALSGSRVIEPTTLENGRLQGGAVLVATPEFMRDNPGLLHALLVSHEVSTVTTHNNLDECIEFALASLQQARQRTVPELFWMKGASRLRFDTEPPLAELEALLATARTLGSGGEQVDLGELVVSGPLEAARQELEPPEDGQ